MRVKSKRRTSQIFFLMLSVLGIIGISASGLIYPYFFCYACPFAVASCPLGLMEHAAISMVLIGIMDGLILFAYTLGFMAVIGLLVGRSFCGWACPIGLIQDGINKLRAMTIGKYLTRFDRDMPRLKYLKYIFIPFIPLAAYLTLELFYTKYCPVGGITGTFPTLLFSPGVWEPSSGFLVKIISVTLFFVLVVVVGRGWCRFLCPIGAIFAPFNKMSGVKLQCTDGCKDCSKPMCADACPMQIEAPGVDDDPECVLCGRCVDACAFQEIKIKFRWWKSE